MQWAAVRNTSGAINEPEQNGTASPPKVTSIAPTLGCPFPSSSPKVMAAACGVTTRPTTAVIAATINILRMRLPPARRSRRDGRWREVQGTSCKRYRRTPRWRLDRKRAPTSGAGDGNRTRTTSLEGWSSAIELRPRGRASLARSQERSRERRCDRRQDHHDEERSLPPDRDRGDRDPEHPLVDRERLTVPEGLHRDERPEEGGSEELDHAREPLGERTAAEQHRADRLDRNRAEPHHPDDEPRLAHRLNPSRHAALAAMIGTPAGANGVSASAIVAPSNAAAT